MVEAKNVLGKEVEVEWKKIWFDQGGLLMLIRLLLG